MKFIYHQPRHKRRPRPSKPKFAMTGILVGIVIGWIVGFRLELGFRQSMIMMETTMVSLVLGSGFEAIRFWWRMRRFRADNESTR